MLPGRVRRLAWIGALLAMPAMHGGARERPAPPESLRLDQLQLLGSHNSYRPWPTPQVQRRLQAHAPSEWPALAYGHPPLQAQLALGLLQFELDVAADPHGGLYAAPYAHGRAAAATLAKMRMPGAKVLHQPGLDYASHCLRFRDCLAIFARWSQAHPRHAPLVVLVNAVDFDPSPGVWPHRAAFDAAGLDALDRDIAEVLGRARLIVPDDVRGTAPSLRAAVLDRRWPTLAQARGRLLFVLDGNPRHEALYRQGHPSLAGRMMFGWYAADAAEAAVLSIEDPQADAALIRTRVAQGYIVRTRADVDGVQARAHDRRRAQAALDAGAQWISTDYYAGAPDPLRLGYQLGIAAGLRCDRVSARCDGGGP
ncbi:Ca2+-dependent phosphoinositide-specific phospholipase C [Xanthomonas sp. 1678]|uniref:Ca2+-dependent phosphoinositide-specific phospholipase C n=1 Tax=Xanthomonas sp. 1678 TaxID=3158788 RepID=UPI0028649D5F|nr:hypothetical protein [Xanthomonas translucens]